jgi:hypothetical protein
MEGKGYSLWLMPAGRSYTTLAGIIHKLSDEFGTPQFHPHITLIGGLELDEKEIVEKTARLTSMIKPFSVQLGEIKCLDNYFVAMFASVHGEELLDAKKMAADIFGLQPKDPHLSLLYGNVGPADKKAAARKIGPLNFGFKIDKLYLYSTKGPVNKWHEVRQFRLGK